MSVESNQTQNTTLTEEVGEIWNVLTAHEKRTMEFGLYPASLVTDAARKCGCEIEQVVNALRECANRAEPQAA